MNPMGLRTGCPLAEPLRTCEPYWHWSPTTRPTSLACIRFSTLFSCQLVALAGCSWTKYLPFSSCSRYTDTTKSMCLMARAMALRIFSGSLVLRAFRACHVEKAVQQGDPMTI